MCTNTQICPRKKALQKLQNVTNDHLVLVLLGWLRALPGGFHGRQLTPV
jgi:hypothetical protein